MEIRIATITTAACILGLFLFQGCREAENKGSLETKQEKAAKAAMSLRDSTGWTHFSVQVGESDEGTTIILSSLPGTVDGHITYHILEDGSVEEWESP